MDSQFLDTSLHDRLHAEWMKDPEYQEAYQRAARQTAQIDAVINTLDVLRVDLGLSKAELARRVGRNASSVRRLFTASGSRPELSLIVAIADALDAEVRVMPRKRRAHRVSTELRSPRRVAVAR
jgi:DNA-binding phage protein